MNYYSVCFERGEGYDVQIIHLVYSLNATLIKQLVEELNDFVGTYKGSQSNYNFYHSIFFDSIPFKREVFQNMVKEILKKHGVEVSVNFDYTNSNFYVGKTNLIII